MSLYEVIKSVVCAIGRVVAWFYSPKEIEKRERKRVDQDIRRMQDAVKGGDETAVNREVHKIIRNAPVVLVLAGCLFGGCVTREPVAFIASEERVVRMMYQDRPGWWVPDDVMVVLMEKAKWYNETLRPEVTCP